MMDLFSGLLGGRGGGYTSGDGLVHLPNLSPEDALAGWRSVLDFRHIYGPDTKVPNINFGGQVVSGKLPDSDIDPAPQQYRPGDQMITGMGDLQASLANNQRLGAAQGGGGFANALSSLGGMLRGGGKKTGGDAAELPAQPDGQGAFQRLLDQLWQDQRQSSPVGGQYANFLSQRY